jgi:hypothetical protein
VISVRYQLPGIHVVFITVSPYTVRTYLFERDTYVYANKQKKDLDPGGQLITDSDPNPGIVVAIEKTILSNRYRYLYSTVVV